MKIGIFLDLRFTALYTPTGVTKHIVNMVKGLNDVEDNEVIVLGAKDQLTDKGEIPEDNMLSYLKARRLPNSWKNIYWKSMIFGNISFNSFTEDLDWVYCPKNDYLPFKNVKYAVTFHGAHELDPEYQNKKGIIQKTTKIISKIRYKQMLAQATVILTVSEFLKTKILKTFDVNPKNIMVVGNGVEQIFFDNSIHYNKTDNYSKDFICVGGLNFMDGGDRIIKIAKKMIYNKDKRKILVVGNQNERKLLKQIKRIDNIILLGYLNSIDLANIMSNAGSLLYFTRYETFGIAAAEAMALGLPIITVRSTAVPEIVRNAGTYIDEIDSYKLDYFFLEEIDFSEKVETGKKIASEYRWESCVNRLVKILNSEFNNN